jgi:hypothetical protein
VPLTQALGNLIDTLQDLHWEILLLVWGPCSYDENHLDPAELSSSHAIQGVAVDAATRSWRIAEQRAPSRTRSRQPRHGRYR